LDRIDALPIANWLFYVLLYVFAVLYVHATLWIDNVLPFGDFDPIWVFNGVYAVISLAMLHSLEHSANRSVGKFVQLAPDKEEEIELQRYMMTTIPARPVLWMTIVFGAFMVYLTLSQPEYLPTGIHSPVAIGLSLLILVFNYSFVPIVIYQGARLLKAVTRLYALVDEVNIFHQQPLYAFSGLSFQASLFWILFANLSFFSLVIESSFNNVKPVDFAFWGVMMLLAIATFLVPPWRIHTRLVEAKLAVQEETSVQIDETQRKLFAAIRKNDHKAIGGLDSAISSLYRMHEQLKSVPTWPWKPGAFRNLLSAVFLPMLLWLFQEIASRYF
jgi:hypothetical protein